MRKIFLISILSTAFIGCGSDNFAPENENTKGNSIEPYPLSVNDDGTTESFPQDIEFITLSHTDTEGYAEEPVFIPNRVIQTSESWEALLTQIEELSNFVEDESIDFEAEQVVYCVYFDKAYTTNVASITEYEDSVVVKVDYFDNPDTSILVEERFHHHLVKMPKTDKEVVFEIEYESEPPYQYYQ
ncbi:MAG: hypothetical protein WCY89_05695 [Flavobacteriaceae bacterium]